MCVPVHVHAPVDRHASRECRGIFFSSAINVYHQIYKQSLAKVPNLKMR